MNKMLLDTLASKYDVCVRTIKLDKRLRFSCNNPFFEISSLLKESNDSLSAEYDVHVRTISRCSNNHSVDIDNNNVWSAQRNP